MKSNPPAGNSRQEILDVATRMFAEQAYELVVIRDIAQAAGVTNPTIYHFFGSKAGLYREAVLGYYASRIAPAALPGPEAPPRQRLHAFVLQLLQALAHDEIFFQLLQRELLSSDEAFKQSLAQTLMLELYQYFDDILAQTRFGRGNTLIPTMIMSMILGYFQVARFQKYLLHFADQPADDAATLEKLADEVVAYVIPEGK